MTPQIQTDNKTGTFFIEYMLAYIFRHGDNWGRTDVVRSGYYPISVDAPMTVTVTKTNNSGEGSLRQALADVSIRGEILFNLSYPATIVLDSQLVVDRIVTITGPEAGKLIISGNSQYRVFDINKRLKVNISNLTISGGNGGIHCYGSELNLENVFITGNIVNNGDGGGIYCRGSNLSFSNVTITDNSASNRGGGIAFGGNCNILFDSESRSNIYFNHAVYGNDLYHEGNSLIDVVLDTFTVLYPTGYYAYLPRNFTFDILNAKIIQYDADLYVSSDGDNSNSGTSPSEALKTISSAFSRIMADSLNPHTIYIDNGIYSSSTNGEKFPLRLPNYVSLSGTSKENVILDAEHQATVLQIYRDYGGHDLEELRGYRQENTIENLTITGGYASGIQCLESTFSLNNVNILDNTGGGITSVHAIINLTNVTINNNSGGGIESSNSEAKLSNVTITDNTAVAGGGINWYAGTLNLTDVIITNNSATEHGGGIYGMDANYVGNVHSTIIYLANVTIAHNFAEVSGGGIYSSGDWIFNSEQRCNIYSNLANVGDDLKYYRGESIIAVIVDTFTVLNPTAEHATPFDNFTFDILHAAVTDINEVTNNLPTKFALNQNHPNPFNPSTNIKFALPKPETVKIELYNTLGQKVETILNKEMIAGNHEVEFNPQNLSSGLYFYRIEASEFHDVKKMVLLH